MKRRRCTRCRRRSPAPGHTRCRPCKNRYWRENRPTYAELPEWQRKRHIARAYVGVYVRTGRLRPKPCEQCGTTRLVHNDYSKPLAVRWLCQRHHRAEHAREAA
jgi:hypothetical protein